MKNLPAKSINDVGIFPSIGDNTPNNALPNPRKNHEYSCTRPESTPEYTEPDRPPKKSDFPDSSIFDWAEGDDTGNPEDSKDRDNIEDPSYDDRGIQSPVIELG
jgi:hypothetical protein